jgi:selenocysteine lyase/cysteine desulfurase
MTSLQSHTRRGFLATLGLAAGAHRALSQTNTPPTPQADYGFAPGLIYLNTGSLGPTSRQVLDRTIQAWRDVESNPVQMSYSSGAVHVATDGVRAAAAALIGCSADDVLITRSTTEAMNTAALGLQLGRGDRVLTTDQEHHGGTDCWTYLARRRGVVVDTVPITPADLDVVSIVDRFARALRRATRVICVSHILSSTGLRMPIAEIAALARARGVLCIVDGAQALGQIAIDVKALGCHAYAASGHKWLMGPKGTGLLYVSPDAAEAIAPIQWEGGKRYVGGSTGVGSLPLVLGLGVAIEQAAARGVASIERRLLELRAYTIKQLQRLPQVEVINAAAGSSASALVAFILPDRIDSQVVQLALRDKHKIVVKLVEKRWFNGIRISPHVFNTEAEIDRAVQALRAELT